MKKIDVPRVVDAMRCLRDETVKIIECGNKLCHFFIDREDKAALSGNTKVEYLEYWRIFFYFPYIHFRIP